jgi:hypothetical protein
MRRLTPALLLLLAARCVAPTEPLTLDLGELVAPAELRLGIVQAGEPGESAVQISNPGPGALHLTEVALAPEAVANTYRFEVGAAPEWLRPGESAALPVRFVALGDTGGAVTARLLLTTDTDDPRQPGTKQRAEVRLVAEGLRYGLAVTPSPLDLGTVAAGEEVARAITVANRLERPLTVLAPDHLEGRLIFLAVEGEGQLRVEEPVDAEARIPAGGAVLEAGAALRLTVRYRAPAVPLGDGGRGTLRLAGCGDPSCAQAVPVAAHTDNDALRCAPEAVDFGVVYPGQDSLREVVCESRAPVPLWVRSAALAPGDDPALSVGEPSARVLGPGESLRVVARFAPTADTVGRRATGRFTLLAQDPVGGGVARAEVALSGQAGGARLAVHPDPLDFGEVALGTTRGDLLWLENVGYDLLVVSRVLPDVLGTGAFAADTAPLTLLPGEQASLQVRYTPRRVGTERSQIRFTSNDAAEPQQDVDLVGNGLDLPPCRYGLEPAEVSFGAVYVGQSAAQRLVVRNVDRGDCLVRDVRVEPAAGTNPGVFTLSSPVPDPRVLSPGEALDLGLEFRPDQAGGQQAWLTFYISDPQDSNPRVPLYGVGRPLLEVTCPADLTTPAGQAVTLAVQTDGVGRVVAYDWAIVSAPPGGIGTPDQWNPAPPDRATEVFLPFIVGVYTLQATVLDEQGRQASCTTRVTAEGRGLRVTLTWDGAGDVDLHVRRGTVTPWFFEDDCFYSNRTPLWDAAWPLSDGPNPELDFDNTSANGPENTRINVVTVGEVYTVAAHNFSRAQGRRATVQIFCGGGTVPDATLTSRPLTGGEGGNCSVNDFWKAATVIFDSASVCRIMPLDAYVPSQDACVGY